MFKKILTLVSAFCIPALVSAQATLSSKDMVCITPALSTYLDLPSDAVSSLGMKLNQMVTQNGFGSTSGQFVLTANVVTLDKQATATAPAQFVVDVEASFYVINVTEQVIVDEMSLTLKGVDRLENKAVIHAINQIKPRSPQVRMFMDRVRTSIIEYYNTRIPALLSKAQSLAERKEYNEALYVLSAVPESVDQYPMVAEQMSAIYMKKIDYDATAAIREAKGLIAIRDYEGALNALLYVDPASSQSKQAFALIDEIKKSVDAKEQRELEEKWRIYEDKKEAAKQAHSDKVMLEKMRIEAAQKVGTEQSTASGIVLDLLNKWFIGRFFR